MRAPVGSTKERTSPLRRALRPRGMPGRGDGAIGGELQRGGTPHFLPVPSRVIFPSISFFSDALMRSLAPLAAAALLAPCTVRPCLAQRGGAAPAADRGRVVSAPISRVEYDVTFDDSTARQRVIHVAMSFSPGSDAPVVLSLPAWTPGAYEITYFARAVLGFEASADGKPLPWDKLDYDTWRIQAGGAKRVTVAFDYLADTLDNAMAWARRDFVMFNGTNIFLYPEGRGFDFPSTVRVHTDPGWRVTTAMTPGTEPNTFTAPNYHDLVDMPFFVGRFDLDSIAVGPRWLRFAS